MWVAFPEEWNGAREEVLVTAGEALDQICLRCGYTYHFEQKIDEWKLVIADVEHPDSSPEPFIIDGDSSGIIGPKAYLFREAVQSGWLKDYIALDFESAFEIFRRRNLGELKTQSEMVALIKCYAGIHS